MTKALLERIYALIPQDQTRLVDGAVTVVVLLLLVCLALKVAEDYYSRGAETFYPSDAHLRVLMYKLGTGMLTKGSAWKRKVRSKDFALCDRVLSTRLPLVPRAEHVEALVRVCELKDPVEQLPLAYPAMLMIYPNCLLFCSPEYPFPAVGSVHVANLTKIFRPLPVSETFTGLIKVDPTVRAAKKGSEVTFISTLLDSDGEPVWTNSSTYLILHKQPQHVVQALKKGEEPAVTKGDEQQDDDEPQAMLQQKWRLPRDMGRRYAAVSKDNNPIHTSPLAAKAFGFPNTIMHGMYFIIRAASECQQALQRGSGEGPSYPIEVSAKFVRPVVLPAEVDFHVYEDGNKEGSTDSSSRLRYQVKTKNGKVAVDGSFVCNVQSQ